MAEKGEIAGGVGVDAPGEGYRELAVRMSTLHLSRISEMPRIELYLDQLISFVNEELAFMALPGETIVTGAMVNNYVKQRIVPAPARKRYTRRHMATLIFVCAFKRVFSIAQVKQMAEIVNGASIDTERAYDELIGVIEKAMAAQFPLDLQGPSVPFRPEISLFDSEGAEVRDRDVRLFESGIVAVANKVYVEQMLVVEARSREAVAEAEGSGHSKKRETS